MRDTAPGAPGCDGCAFNIVFLYKLSDGMEADEWKLIVNPRQTDESLWCPFPAPSSLGSASQALCRYAAHCRVLHPAASCSHPSPSSSLTFLTLPTKIKTPSFKGLPWQCLAQGHEMCAARVLAVHLPPPPLTAPSTAPCCRTLIHAAHPKQLSPAASLTSGTGSSAVDPCLLPALPAGSKRHSATPS